MSKRDYYEVLGVSKDASQYCRSGNAFVLNNQGSETLLYKFKESPFLYSSCS